MFLAGLAALLCIAPAVGPSPSPTPAASATATAPEAQARGTLVIEPAADGSVTVRDAQGRVAASLVLRSGQRAPVELPPGRYSVTDDVGPPRTVEIAPGGLITLATNARTPASPPAPTSGSPAEATRATPAVIAVAAADPAAPPAARCGGGSCRRWKRIAAPLMSAAMPGSGQLVNGEPGKGIGMFLGAASLGVGALALRLSEDPLASSSAGLQSSTFGSEVAGAAGFGMLTGGLAMLYAAQIMDAYATAAGKEHPTPHTRHRLSTQLTRMATVGLKAGDPAAAFYADWGLNVMAQVASRFSVGLGDLGVKYGAGRTSIQIGPRLHYRFYDRGRVWLGAGAGVILQGTIGPREHVLANTVTVVSRNNGFAAIPYGLLDVRLFILDRWSLDLVPRISAPFGTRFYRAEGAIPSHAVTFELGTGVGVYF